MAVVVITIDTNNHSIQDLNDKIHNDTNPKESLQKLQAYIGGIVGGAINANVSIVTRDTAPTVATSGVKSKSVVHNLK